MACYFDLALQFPYDEHGTEISSWMLELADDGGVLRQLGLALNGSVAYYCTADLFGVWNDELFTLERYSESSEEWSRLIEEHDGRWLTESTFESKWAERRGAPGEWPGERTWSQTFGAWLRRQTRRGPS